MSTPPTANATLQIPPGFRPIAAGGPYMQHNGPLYLRHEAGRVRFGFRVEARHCNPMGNLHGGMMASFCDMLLPLSAHRTVAEVAHRFLPTVSLQLDYLAPRARGLLGRGRSDRAAHHAQSGVHPGPGHGRRNALRAGQRRVQDRTRDAPGREALKQIGSLTGR